MKAATEMLLFNTMNGVPQGSNLGLWTILPFLIATIFFDFHNSSIMKYSSLFTALLTKKSNLDFNTDKRNSYYNKLHLCNVPRD